MTNKLTKAQLDAYWMPFTANRQFKKAPRIIVEAEGCYYTDSDGRKMAFGPVAWAIGLNR